tara:strand:- start:5643 stop:6647 length:1005 start_codon:yes stop_codon:yes gene_type:complete
MQNKSFTYLVYITIVLFFLALLSYLIQPRYETSLKKGEIIFDKIQSTLNDINEIIIDNGKKKVSIIKDNENWYMTSKFNYKIKNEIVRKNLIQISELRYFEKKTKEGFLYSRLDLNFPDNDENKSKFISIIDKNGNSLVEFILGKRKKNGVYIRKKNDEQSWLTAGILDMSSIEKDWLETNILNIDFKDVKMISMNHSKKEQSFSLTKDEKNENFLIENLTKDQLPKSDLIANFLGYLYTNLFFEDVSERKKFNEDKFLTKIDFELFNDTKISAIIFTENDIQWINFSLNNESINELKKQNIIFVDDINNWSYKLSSTKYNDINTKLKDLLVED